MNEKKKLDDQALEDVAGGSGCSPTMEAYNAYVAANCTGCVHVQKHGHCFYGRDVDRLYAFCSPGFDRNAPCRYKNS